MARKFKRSSPKYNAWAAHIKKRAGGQCEVSGGFIFGLLSIVTIVPHIWVKTFFENRKSRHHYFDYSTFTWLQNVKWNGIYINEAVHSHFHSIMGRNNLTVFHFGFYLMVFFPLVFPFWLIKFLFYFITSPFSYFKS